MITKVVIFGSCFAADDFAPSQKLQRQRSFCSSQSIEVNRSYIVGKKSVSPKVLNISPPPKKTCIHKNTHIPKHTHAHTTHTHNHRAWRAFEVVGGSEHNVLCTLSRFDFISDSYSFLLNVIYISPCCSTPQKQQIYQRTIVFAHQYQPQTQRSKQ